MRILPIALVVVLGIALTLAAFDRVRRAHRRHLQQGFRQVAADHTSALERAIDREAGVLRAVRSFFALAGEVDGARLAAFADPLMTRADGAIASGYAPRVAPEDRERYERSRRQEGSADFMIWERSPAGERIRAAERDAYFPVDMIHPIAGNEAALGFDLASEAVRRDAIERARVSGELAMTAPIRLVQETRDQASVLLLLPRFAPGPSGGDSRGPLIGVVSGVVRAGDLLEAAVGYVEPAGADMLITDEDAPEADRILAFHASRTRNGPATRESIKEAHWLTEVASIEVGGRVWTITTAPAPAFLKADASLLPVAILGGGILFTACVAFFLLQRERHATAVRGLDERLAAEAGGRSRAEHALRQRESREEAFLASASIALYAAEGSGDHSCTWVSEQIEAICGFPAERFVSESGFWASRLHPDDRERVIGAAGGSREYRWRHADGSYRWLLDNATIVPGSDDLAPQVIGTVLDVTDRKEAEAALFVRDSAIEATSSGIVITDPNQPDNPIVYCNEAVEQMTGYRRDQLLGKNCRFLQRGDRDQPALAELRAACSEGRGCRVVLRNYRADGTLFWNELTLSPIRDTDGRLTHYVGSQQDITEAKQSQDALRASETRYRMLVQNAPLAIHEIDLDGHLTTINDAGVEMFGCRVEGDLIGRSFEHCVSEEDRPHVRGMLRRAFDGYIADFEFTSDDRQRVLAAILTPMQGDDGEVTRLMGVTRDITERKRYDRRRKLLMDELDHRVKNNLAAVLALADQAMTSTLTVQEFHEVFTGRLHSLARTHEALARESWLGLEMGAIVRRSIEPYLYRDPGRVSIGGPRLLITSRAALPLALALHELATNSIRHGSLRVADGTVAIFWTTNPDRSTELTWRERVTVPVEEPERRGSGSGVDLVVGLIEHELRGRARFEFRPDGLVATLTLPETVRQEEMGPEPRTSPTIVAV